MKLAQVHKNSARAEYTYLYLGINPIIMRLAVFSTLSLKK